MHPLERFAIQANFRKGTQVNITTSLEEFDVVILGGGTGGTLAAWTLAGQGQRVAVIERKYIGGSCPNIACLPSKNIIQSAKVASYFRRGREFGITNGNFTVDMGAVRERKRRMVSGWNNIYLENYKKTGAEFILGSGRFIGPKTLEVTLRTAQSASSGEPTLSSTRARTLQSKPYLASPMRSHSRISKHSN